MDKSTEIDFIQQEIETTIDILRQENNKVKRLEKKIDKLKTSNKKRYSKKECFNILAIKRILKALLKRVKNKVCFWRSSKKKSEENTFYTGVSVIIPTYKPNDYLKEAVESVLIQACENITLEVIIGVNGKDRNYYDNLKQEYLDVPNVHVVYTERSGVSAGRNEALKKASYSHVMFLDDDDIFSKGYINEFVKLLDANIEFVQGKFWDEGTEDETNNYINNCLKRMNKDKCKKSHSIYSSIFSTVTGKLISKDKLLTVYYPFCEELNNSEDVYFWAQNFDFLKNDIRYFADDVEEYYIRKTREGSLSKPVKENEYEYWIKDRLLFIHKLEKLLVEKEMKADSKDLVLRFIISQNDFMYNYYQKASVDEQEIIRKAIMNYEGLYVKKMLYSNKKGIAFCYNFPPLVDTSAYVAARRLRQINKNEKAEINWTVVTKDSTASHSQDNQFKKYYADFVCGQWRNVGGKFNFSAKEQFAFAKCAIHKSRDLEADVIYSRSMHPASHLVAYAYKKEHPDVIWYAEFSDPISRTAELVPRKETMENSFGDEDKYLIELYDVCEKVVYEAADHIIFTNDVQFQYMLSYNPWTEYSERVKRNCLIWNHPIIEKEMLNIGNVTYELDNSQINIGYFGRFYPNRSIDDMLALLKNEQVCIHIFALNPKDIKYLQSDRIKINNAAPYLNFLNIASKMDYLFLNDMNSDMGIIPWLPSKLSDYLASGAKIIAKYIDGSPMSTMEHDNLIKTKEITEEFSMTLKKEK